MDKFQELNASELQSVVGGGVGSFLARVCEELEKMLSTGGQGNTTGVPCDVRNRAVAAGSA